ncbi:unnamed protein product, partial [Cylicostephanus goldi]
KELAEQFEARVKELQTQIEVSYSKQKRKKELQIEVEELRKKLAEVDAVKEELQEDGFSDFLQGSDMIFWYACRQFGRV